MCDEFRHLTCCSVYDGEWANDMREGLGMLRFDDGNSCEPLSVMCSALHITSPADNGQWSRNEWDGQGLLSCADVHTCLRSLAAAHVTCDRREHNLNASGATVQLGGTAL
jgi:hypothetical protein